MKVAEFKKCIKRVTDPHLVNLKATRSILHRTPVHHVLFGVTHDGHTDYNGDFKIWAFIDPLFVPREHLVLNFGQRYSVRGDLGDSKDERTRNLETIMIRECLPFWEHVTDLASLQGALKKSIFRFGSSEAYDLEVLASTQILLGQNRRANRTLNELIDHLEPSIEKRPWIPEIIDRSRLLLGQLRDDPQTAVAQLEEWTAFTKAHLKLVDD